MGMLTLNSKYNGDNIPIVEAAEEKEKLSTPNVVATPSPNQGFHENGELELAYEYLTSVYKKYGDTEILVKDIASLEIKFFLASETFSEDGTYATIVRENQGNVLPGDIIGALKSANYPSSSTVKVAIRYLAKVEGYLNSDYYIVTNLAGEEISYTYNIEYINSKDYNVYIFGGATEKNWDFDANTMLKLDDEIYSIEYKFSKGEFRLYLLSTQEDGNKEKDFEKRREFAIINIETSGTYKLQFSFRNHENFIPLTNDKSSEYNGYYRLEYLSSIDKNSTSGNNVLFNKEVYSTTNPTDPKVYTNGTTTDGFQIKENQQKDTYYIWDLDQIYALDKMNIYWERACPTEYNIFVSTNQIDDLESFEYITDSSETWSDWTLFQNVKCEEAIHTDNISLDQPILARYVLLQTVEAREEVYGDWGYNLYEIEAFTPSDHLLYGAQVGKSDNAKAIRFIGLARIEDVNTYSDDVVLELTYKGDKTFGPRKVSINNYYKTLTTSLNGVLDVTLNADDIMAEDTEGNYYFFSFTLIGILDGTYEITLKVNDLQYQTITYNYENGALSRAE